MTTPRIRVSPTEFKVSAPGQNVLTTPSQNLLLDGFGTHRALGVLLAGNFNSSSPSAWNGYNSGVFVGGNPTWYIYYHDVSFGVTLSAAPDFMLVGKYLDNAGHDYITVSGTNYKIGLYDFVFKDAADNFTSLFGITNTTLLRIYIKAQNANGVNLAFLTWYYKEIAYQVFYKG
jgi:hypothetical protein